MINLKNKNSVPTNKGGYIAIKINQELYEQQFLVCKHALIARVILSKGETPWKLADLKRKISQIWGITNN